MLLSVVLPCYNVEKYIERCLDSIVESCPADTEIIVVNDGSPDNTVQVAEKWFAKHPEIPHKILNKENGGQGSARNMGIDAASGDYITFVDPDDLLIKGEYSRLLRMAEEYDFPDLVVANMELLDNETGAVLRRTVSDRVDYVKGYESRGFFLTINEEMLSSACAKFFKREIFDGNPGLKFIEEQVKREDIVFDHLFVKHINSILSVERDIYSYMINQWSTSNKFYQERELRDVARVRDLRSEMISTLLEEPKRSELLLDLKRLTAFQWITTIYGLYKSGTEHKKYWLKRICEEAAGGDPDWLQWFKVGNPRIIRLSMRLGLWAPHLILSIARSIPSLRRRLRG